MPRIPDVTAFAPGSTARLDVLHNGKGNVVSLTLGQLPNTQEAKADLDTDRKESNQARMFRGSA
jgi:serine protease Do